ncbi:hypothetical protein SAMN05216421_2911 [Halopseudomonas xinjiangensis]|uniref:Uncharacterized protein n=1 Tax=Halopseudomonas xinjiangensis TaxID=487184 RepID=A0A1H1XN13_9GAMM|nr:hypothetical protein [Halopseudomonas xinjiangensis]SDT10588.1 hypothetical protein SAMN05216421_2911 [Halopseudomonas xinjiangensis]
MKARTVHYTWMAFSLAALGMLAIQNAAPEQSYEPQTSLNYSIQHQAGHTIQPVSLPVVTRQVNQIDTQAHSRQTWTF